MYKHSPEICKPGTKPCGCVSWCLRVGSCWWRRHLYYVYLLDETRFKKYSVFLECGAATAKEELLGVREWEWEAVVWWKRKPKEGSWCHLQRRGSPPAFQRTTEMELMRRVGELITHPYCIISVEREELYVIGFWLGPEGNCWLELPE